MAHLYNEETISQAIDTKWAGKTVHFAKETDSTNSWIKRLAKDGAEHGTLAVAEFQSAGRGRFDRRWEAPEGRADCAILGVGANGTYEEAERVFAKFREQVKLPRFTVLRTERGSELPALIWLVLFAPFIIDATLTLLKRVRERKRLSEAHREHLYQQFIIAGHSHTRVTASMLLLSLGAALAALVWRAHPLALFAAVYGLLGVGWAAVYRRFRSDVPMEEKTAP